MTEPEPSIVERAFAKTFTRPRALGRREPDQVKWWVHAIKTLGFPVVVAWFVLARLEPQLAKLTAAVERNTIAVVAQTCRMDPRTCGALALPPGVPAHLHKETTDERP